MNRRAFNQNSLLFAGSLWVPLQTESFLTGPRHISKTDTHVHLFNLAALNYPWLENAPEIRKPLTIKDFAVAAKKANVGKFVFMESGAMPSQSLKEVDWVIQQAKIDNRLKGIIARADIDLYGNIVPTLDQLTATNWVKGIRNRVNQELLESAGFVKGLQRLGKKELSIDLLLNPKLLYAAAKAIAQCPGTIFIVDHLGYPEIESGETKLWEEGMAKLAQLPNVNCKISGIINKAGHHWSFRTLQPYVQYVIDQFGFERIVYGGDWPNSLRASKHYMEWARAFEKITKPFSRDELKKLYHLNADRIYQLT